MIGAATSTTALIARRTIILPVFLATVALFSCRLYVRPRSCPPGSGASAGLGADSTSVLHMIVELDEIVGRQDINVLAGPELGIIPPDFWNRYVVLGQFALDGSR
jgi:hypothetical protein